jgi:hypothetical protein
VSADTLRKAARLMRERGEAATPGPWENEPNTGAGRVWVRSKHWFKRMDCEPLFNVRNEETDYARRAADAAHIASWHPAVALAVADWLDAECDDLARRVYLDPMDDGLPHGALVVARAYLGESS